MGITSTRPGRGRGLAGEELQLVLEEPPVPSSALTEPTPPIDTMSLREIQREKQRQHEEVFGEAGDTKPRVRKGADVSLPSWARALVACARGSACFRECVAREPETPLTELHLMQPLLALLLALGLLLLLVTAAVASGIVSLPGAALRAVEIIVSALACLAAGGLFVAGLIARDVPTPEGLNVQVLQLGRCTRLSVLCAA